MWGQSKKSYPSLLPDERITNDDRSSSKAEKDSTLWDPEKTYMVSGDKHEGKFANQDSKWSMVFDADAYPMNVYKNGSKIKSSFQGVFNDHRKASAINIDFGTGKLPSN